MKSLLFFIRFALVAVLLAAATIQARAQNTIRVVGTFVKEGQSPPADAVAEAKLFSHIARQYPMREPKWQWVIVVDDAMWNQLMTKMDLREPGMSYYGQTDIDHQITFVRGFTLLHPDQPAANPDHVISHEMAHVYLHSRDEALVDRTSQEWMKTAKAKLAGATTAITAANR